MKIHIQEVHLHNEDPVLAGRLSGRRAFARAVEELSTLEPGRVVALDFRAVDLATSSFLSEAVLALRDHLSGRQPPAYLIVANLNQAVEEELEYLLSRASDALLSCTISNAAHRTSKIKILGTLEPALRDTYELVRKRGLASAIELHSESSGQSNIGPTAWNNRLATLVKKSLLLEVTQGRSKKYRPVLEQ